MNLPGSGDQGQAAGSVSVCTDVSGRFDGDVWGRLAVSTSGAYSLCLPLGTLVDRKRPQGSGLC